MMISRMPFCLRPAPSFHSIWLNKVMFTFSDTTEKSYSSCTFSTEPFQLIFTCWVMFERLNCTWTPQNVSLQVIGVMLQLFRNFSISGPFSMIWALRQELVVVRRSSGTYPAATSPTQNIIAKTCIIIYRLQICEKISDIINILVYLMTSVFLGKYKSKKRLGKGAFGDVMLVEDADGNEFALKMIKKKMLEKDPYLEEYLEGEKDCMLDVDSPYIMKLYSFEEDDNFKYMLCEYCNGGDLLNHQAKQEKKVYTLDKATEILSEVIRGLEYLHDRGYVHRDIKPQNILIKYDGKGELQKPIFKLADFGFAKKFEDVGGTILGTENYMSPEIYTNEIYGFEVDMWAFGVLFYFMLNMQYPFNINPHLPVERKRQELKKQAKGFSYGNLVKKSKKKNTQNCTEEMEDLFRRIFNSDAESRIGWVEIREHPVFRKHFPVITEDSKIIYKNKAQNKLSSYIIKKQSVIVKNPEKIKNKMEAIEQQEENADISIFVGRKKHKQYAEEKNFIEMKYEKIKFLYDSQQQMTDASEVLTNQEILSFRYCMLRHYLILLGDFLKDLNPDDLKKDVETYKWDDFVKTKQFRKMREEYQEHYDFVELALGHTGRICENFLDEIAKFNQPLCMLLDISFNKQAESFAEIKKPYRISTKASYSKLKDLTKKGNKYSFLAVIAVICHAFNRIVEDDENHLKELFAKYISNKEGFIDFSYIRSKLTSASEKELSELANLIYQAYF